MLLVDTSIWIELFRKPATVTIADVGDFDEIATCLPVLQEVLQGFREESAFRHARQSMLALPIIESPMTADLFLEATQLYRSARRAGITIRSSTDCLIAACALRHDFTVVHRDRDYDLLATVSALKVKGA